MRCRKQVARKGGRCRVLRSSLGSTIDWYPKIRWGGSGLAAVALRLKLQRLQPRLLEHQSAIAHWLSPTFSLFAPVEIVGALVVGFNLPVDANQIIQPAARLNYSRAELPLSTDMDFLEQVDASESETLTQARHGRDSPSSMKFAQTASAGAQWVAKTGNVFRTPSGHQTRFFRTPNWTPRR